LMIFLIRTARLLGKDANVSIDSQTDSRKEEKNGTKQKTRTADRETSCHFLTAAPVVVAADGTAATKFDEDDDVAAATSGAGAAGIAAAAAVAAIDFCCASAMDAADAHGSPQIGHDKRP